VPDRQETLEIQIRTLRSAYGVESFALQLDVRPSAIYHWIRAATTPRPAHAEIIKRLARERGYRLNTQARYEVRWFKISR
jgi:hypothetical protein